MLLATLFSKALPVRAMERVLRRGHCGPAWVCPLCGWTRLTGALDPDTRSWDVSNGNDPTPHPPRKPSHV